jgi:hypothetical protein
VQRTDAREAGKHRERLRGGMLREPTVWQFDKTLGCWIGVPQELPCLPLATAKTTWVGAQRTVLPSPPPVHNATLVALDEHFRPVAVHTVIAPSSSAPASVGLSLDVPSPLTGTGSALLLDGRDVALVRASLLDASGALISVSAANTNITFRILSGPGRLIGIGNGDRDSHQQQQGDTSLTYGGLARAIVQASVDCTSAGRHYAIAIDSDGGNARTTVVPENQPCPVGPIVLQAIAEGLPSSTISIPVSGNVDVDSVLAVAAANVGLQGGYAYLDDFVG